MTDSSLWETILCPLCGSSDYAVICQAHYPADWDKEKIMEIYFSSSDHKLSDQLVKCKECGLVYINPRILPALIIKSYSNAVDPRFVQQNPHRIRSFSSQFRKLIKKMNITPDRKKKVLDIGCAGGAFPKAANDLGFTVTGIEPSKWMCEFAQAEYGLDIRPGTIFDQDFQKGSFDIITLWDVLEHLPSPAAVLEECHKYLHDDGFLVLTYPDYGSWVARILGKNWPFLLSVHLTYYTRKTIQKQLSQTGYVTVWLKPYWQTLQLDYLLERASRYFSILKPFSWFVKASGLSKIPCKYYMAQTIAAARKQDD